MQKKQPCFAKDMGHDKYIKICYCSQTYSTLHIHTVFSYTNVFIWIYINNLIESTVSQYIASNKLIIEMNPI